MRVKLGQQGAQRRAKDLGRGQLQPEGIQGGGGEDLARGAIQLHAAGAQDDHAVRLGGFIHVVGDEHHGHPAGFEGVDLLHQHPPPGGVDHGGGLIEEHQARLHGQHACQRQALHLPGGKQVGRPPALGFQPGDAQGILHPGADLRGGQAQVLGTEGDILLHAGGDDLLLGGLEDHPDRGADHFEVLPVAGIQPVHPHAALIRQQQGVHQAQERGFTRAVGAQQRREFAFPQGEADAAQGRHGGATLNRVAEGNVFDLQDGGGAQEGFRGGGEEGQAFSSAGACAGAERRTGYMATTQSYQSPPEGGLDSMGEEILAQGFQPGEEGGGLLGCQAHGAAQGGEAVARVGGRVVADPALLQSLLQFGAGFIEDIGQQRLAGFGDGFFGGEQVGGDADGARAGLVDLFDEVRDHALLGDAQQAVLLEQLEVVVELHLVDAQLFGHHLDGLGGFLEDLEDLQAQGFRDDVDRFEVGDDELFIRLEVFADGHHFGHGSILSFKKY